ncbi:MAG TPA: DUF998 domain-containing protein, partial [Pyrinomonadaceae bacterium]|nr:DUF998 domain-containing protein [Pyrinomonadaceae bacterium]
MTTLFLTCGVLAPLVYIATDLVAGLRYPGYSFTAQAVSELFAIGAPTSRLVVPLFSLASGLFLAFAFGMWQSSGGRRLLRLLGLMIAGNAVNSLVLWIFFPMHMRGDALTFTDTMHVILAINPFVLASIVLGVAAFRGWLRLYSVATILILVALAILAFSYVPEVAANQPTPWFGLAERISQYAHGLWHAVLAIVLLTSSFQGGVHKTGDSDFEPP